MLRYARASASHTQSKDAPAMLLNQGAAAAMYGLGEGALIATDGVDATAAVAEGASSGLEAAQYASAVNRWLPHEEVRNGLLGLPLGVGATALAGAGTLRGVIDSRRVASDHPQAKGSRRSLSDDQTEPKIPEKGFVTKEADVAGPLLTSVIPSQGHKKDERNSSSDAQTEAASGGHVSIDKSEVIPNKADGTSARASADPIPLIAPSASSLATHSKEEGSAKGSGEAGEEGIAGRPLDLNQAPTVENGGEQVVSGIISTARKDLTRGVPVDSGDEESQENDGKDETGEEGSSSDGEPDTVAAAKAAFKEKMLR